MTVIEGKVYDGPDGTRSYFCAEKNMEAHVVDRNDIEFMSSDDKFRQAAVYMLIGYPQATSATRVYVGQTTDIRRRFTEHVRKKDFWQFMMFFQPIYGLLTGTDVMYLEHMLVRGLVEYGNVQLLENCQIPVRPVMHLEDIMRMDEFFDGMKFMMHYAGFPFFLHKCYNTAQNACFEKIAGKKNSIPARVAREYVSEAREPDMTCDDDGFTYGKTLLPDEEDDGPGVTYVLRGPDYSAQAIPLGDGTEYMILPFGRVKPRTEDEYAVLPEDARGAIDVISSNITGEMKISDLETFVRIVANSSDISLIRKE